jgi:tRNA A58 N-methylase Trm61
LARHWVREVLCEGDLAIDATAGNGHDTLFLAECVGPSGRVLAFDIQAGAVEATRERLERAGCLQRVCIHHASHARMVEFVELATARVVMFNLGYLPGGDHTIITEPAETLTALEAAAACLMPGGVLSVVCYPGHPGGDEEAAHVENWLTARSAHGWRMAKYTIPGTKHPAPILLVACTADG